MTEHKTFIKKIKHRCRRHHHQIKSNQIKSNLFAINKVHHCHLLRLKQQYQYQYDF